MCNYISRSVIENIRAEIKEKMRQASWVGAPNEYSGYQGALDIIDRHITVPTCREWIGYCSVNYDMGRHCPDDDSCYAYLRKEEKDV